MLVGAACAAALARARRPGLRSAGLGLLAAYGGLALLSTLWSDVAIFSFVRGTQVVVVTLLALVSADAWRRGRRDLLRDWRWIWERLLLVVAALAVFGLLVPSSASRWSWPGTHPVIAGAYLAISLVVGGSMLLERGWRPGRNQRRLLLAALAGFAVLMVVNATRSTLAAGAVAVAAVYLTRAARQADLRWLVLPGIGLLAASAATLYSDGLSGYVLRGQTVEQFATLSDRTSLWALAWELAQERLWFGGGYGVGRSLFPERFPWAGTAHSLWAEVAVDLGMVGLAAAAGLLGWALVTAWRLQRRSPGPVSNASLGALTVVAVASLAETGFTFPGVMLTCVGLAVAGLSAARRSPSYHAMFARRARPG